MVDFDPSILFVFGCIPGKLNFSQVASLSWSRGEGMTANKGEQQEEKQ